MSSEKDTSRVVFKLDVMENRFDFASSIETALNETGIEISHLQETITSVEGLKPNCDKLDYALAASSGALCGIIDIFLVGKPGESPAGDITDQWFANRTIDFARLCGWNDRKDNPLPSAVRFLENTFGISYDQRGAGDAGGMIFDLNPANHHFKSLGHNPTLLGLFFSILDQFTNQSHFISNGELVSLQDADGSLKLQGNSVPAKLVCGFVNWFGHLVSDLSGSSGSKGRGMGIPSPFWAWTNDAIAIKRKLNIPASEFNKNINELALNIYNKGYDIRFQAVQAIPVFVNEIIVRLIYSARRMVRYFASTEKGNRSATELWNKCEPFSNPTVKRMLTVAHGVFCMMDVGDAMVRGFATGGGGFNSAEFVLRLNVVGAGRFAVSLYGEGKRAVTTRKAEARAQFAIREKAIVINYIEGLSLLAKIYNDNNTANFVNDFKNSDMYIMVFDKSVQLAVLRSVPDEKILRTKADIDTYFGGKRDE